MGDYRDPDYERRALAHTALTQAREALTHFDDPQVAQAAFGAHAPGLVQAGWPEDLVQKVGDATGRSQAGHIINGLIGALSQPTTTLMMGGMTPRNPSAAAASGPRPEWTRTPRSSTLSAARASRAHT